MCGSSLTARGQMQPECAACVEPCFVLFTGEGTSQRGRDMGEESNPNTTTLTNVEGVVKWFDPRKGFGFIVGPEGQDIFAHYSVIQGDGFRVLKDGSPVVYDATRSDKGWKATRVVRAPDSVEVTVPPRRGYSRSPRR